MSREFKIGWEQAKVKGAAGGGGGDWVDVGGEGYGSNRFCGRRDGCRAAHSYMYEKHQMVFAGSGSFQVQSK